MIYDDVWWYMMIYDIPSFLKVNHCTSSIRLIISMALFWGLNPQKHPEAEWSVVDVPWITGGYYTHIYTYNICYIYVYRLCICLYNYMQLGILHTHIHIYIYTLYTYIYIWLEHHIVIHHIDSDAHRCRIAKTGSVPPWANAIHCGSSEELRQQGERGGGFSWVQHFWSGIFTLW